MSVMFDRFHHFDCQVFFFTLLAYCFSVFPVGSFVWSHLTNVLRSEDPMKQTLIDSLPDDIISREFESELLKYSSYSDYTAASGTEGLRMKLQ